MRKIVFCICMLFVGMGIVSAKDKVEFVSCVDGDTFKVNLEGKISSVRLLAVDAPESVHPDGEVEYYGVDASDYTCDIISNASVIELEYDEASSRVDKYDRVLAWVYVDGELLQKLLVSNGYAEVAYLYGEYKYTELLKELEKKAKNEGIGIWDKDREDNYDQRNSLLIFFVILGVIVSIRFVYKKYIVQNVK